MSDNNRLKRLRFRAWHRGTKEADLMLGGFVDAHGESFTDADIEWMELLLMEQDVEIMAWVMGAAPAPAAYDTPLMARMRKLDYIPTAQKS